MITNPLTPSFSYQAKQDWRIKSNSIYTVENRVNQVADSYNTSLLVVDSNRRIVSLNRKLIQIWNLPRALVENYNDVQAVEFISSLFENPRRFLLEIEEIYSQTSLEVYDCCFLKDGRIFERQTIPQKLSGKIVGRIWKFREFSCHPKLGESPNIATPNDLRAPRQIAKTVSR